jgi:predicted N-acyltransferase
LPPDSPETTARMRLAVQLATLAVVAYEAWIALAPEHTRKLARMRAAEAARRAALRAARWAGRQGIAIEARTGAERDAAAWYACARCLAQTCAARMQAAYDRARGQ